MTTADDILESLHDDMASHGWLIQCIKNGGGTFELGSRVKELLAELLSSGKVEIGELAMPRPGETEFIAWRGTADERISRAMSAVAAVSGHDKEFAYWLCLREHVDRYE
jgi:hypothetical protein